MADRVPNPPEWVTLSPDERVWLVTCPSTNLVVASLGIGFVLLIVMSVGVGFAASLATGRVVSFATLVGIVALLVGTYVLTSTRQYVLTSERSLVATGLGDKRTSSVPHQTVEDVVVRQERWHRLLGVGTVRVVTDDGSAVEFRLVGSPRDIARQVERVADAGATQPDG